MFCLGIERGYVATWESKLYTLCGLREGALVHGRVRLVLYVY